MKKAVLAFAALLFAAMPVLSQISQKLLKEVPASNKGGSSAVSKASRLPYLTLSADEKNAVLQDLKIDIEIIGNISMTTYEMVFYNPNRFVTEGEFVFPLSAGQSVSAVALEMDGRMREGVVAEKQKIRQDADHAAEKIPANQFRVRVYPFNAEAFRRIRVTVEEPLCTKDNAYVYTLPLNFEKHVNFDLSAEIPSVNSEGIPSVETGLQDFAFKKGNNVLKASFSQKNYLLDDGVSFVLPKPKEEPVFTHKDGTETYFYTDISIQPSQKNKLLPKTLAIVWDCSLSSEKRSVKKELALLDAYFKKLASAEIIFIGFNVNAAEPKKYSVRNGKCDELKKDISRIIYDGATRFDKLDLGAIKAEEILLFTDGLSTLGDTRLVAPKVPVYAISSSPEFNRGALISAERKSGGRFINLNAVSDKEAMQMLTKQTLRLVSCAGGDKTFKELYPQEGMPVSDNFAFAGILTEKSGELVLSFGYDAKNIVETKKITVRAEGDSPAVAKFWAAQKIRSLELDTAKNEKEIVKLGRQYSLVTDFTSLVILETVQDYVSYKAVPPAEMEPEYDRLMKEFLKEEKNREKSAIEEAVLQVHEIKEWWKRDYTQSKPNQSFEKVNSAFGVRQEMIFENSVPAASEGEVKPPSRVARKDAGMAHLVNGRIEIRDSRNFKKNTQPVKQEDALSPSMQIKAWDPQTPYMKILQRSHDDEIYGDYLKLKAGYGEQPSFYFDAANEFIGRKMNDEALVVLSNIAEMNLDNTELLRVAAYKMMEAKKFSYAADMFEKIVKLRGEDPQSHRDLALAYQSAKENAKALKVFYGILSGTWERFQSIKQEVFVEMNNLISLNPGLDVTGIDKRLIFAMPVDIRIVLGWSTDDTDIDIHVKEPSGEEAFYGNRITAAGGRVSEDLTQGFGPEEYMLKKAPEGEYEISVDYVSDSGQGISGPTVLYLDIYTFYGTKKQTHKRVMVRTENVKESDVISTVKFKRPVK